MPDTVLRVGTFTRSVLLALGERDGAFDRVGLDVEEIAVDSSPAQFAALSSGELDLALTSPDNVVAYRFVAANPLGRVLPVRILGAVDRGLGLSLWSAPGVGSFEHLRGRRVGVDVASSGFAFVAYALLERVGLAPGDYEVVALGSTPRRAAALVEGRCAATILNAGNELRVAGAKCTLVDTVDALGPYLGSVIAEVESPDHVVNDARRRFVDVVRSLVLEIVSDRRRGVVEEVARDVLGLTRNESASHYDCLVSSTTGLVASGVVDVASVANLVALRQRYRPSPELDGVAGDLDVFVAPWARPD